MCQGKNGAIYITDVGNHCIRKISEDGMVSTIAGIPGIRGCRNGTALEALFDYPISIAIDEHGNIYVSEHVSTLIRKIDTSGHVTTLVGKVEAGEEAVEVLAVEVGEAVEVEMEAVEVEAGEEEDEDEDEEVAIDGDLSVATFINPRKILVDAKGNLIVTDYHAVREINLETNTVSTILHVDHDYYDLCVDKNGIMYVVQMNKEDYNCQIIKKFAHIGGVPPHIQRVFAALAPQPNQHVTDLSIEYEIELWKE